MSWQESFSHDAAGNLTGPLTVTSGNRLRHAGDTRYEYDGYGNRILEVTGSEEHHYTWDTQHRLTGYRCRVRGQETAHYRYQYDALGRRILKEDLLARTARRFFWQGERLLGECDAGRFWPGRLPDNPQLQEALRDASCRVWLYEDEHDFRPLLMLCGREANAGVYHYVCDHLGTPLELRDVRGGVVWSAMLRSYGQVHHADTAGINQPLRFQGQYHDGESGLYYNRHRYYDPGVGRYLSPDPVGLDGGLNLYSYVPNPLQYIDPLGLCKDDIIFKASKWQGKGDYPGVDDWQLGTLNKGDIIYGGVPGQTEFYLSQSTLNEAEGSMSSLWKSAQVKPHDVFGYRPQVQAYEVLKDTDIATSVVTANPHLGEGGAIQYFVKDYQVVLRATGKPIGLK
ncbi:RHS repeat domain-containing protein [Enterobacter asburiae]|uniref:RHS repeat domain-containing protein n=1 Tax=Enterobacter TaxID=547 RepID=UPI003C2E0385